eukprot:6963401-Alexandrium_andersonii.AAC.1
MRAIFAANMSLLHSCASSAHQRSHTPANLAGFGGTCARKPCACPWGTASTQPEKPSEVA